MRNNPQLIEVHKRTSGIKQHQQVKKHSFVLLRLSEQGCKTFPRQVTRICLRMKKMFWMRIYWVQLHSIHHSLHLIHTQPLVLLIQKLLSSKDPAQPNQELYSPFQGLKDFEIPIILKRDVVLFPNETLPLIGSIEQHKSFLLDVGLMEETMTNESQQDEEQIVSTLFVFLKISDLQSKIKWLQTLWCDQHPL